MRLINCYIENFGGLSRYSLTLQPGITVVEEPNGFGKTTLAEFIRAMFYGFPRASKTLEKNTRKRYQPWQGGRYGGTIIFEHNGKTYRIDRTFGDVPRQDTFALYEAGTHRPSTDFSENIGQELFQLDADASRPSWAIWWRILTTSITLIKPWQPYGPDAAHTFLSGEAAARWLRLRPTFPACKAT